MFNKIPRANALSVKMSRIAYKIPRADALGLCYVVSSTLGKSFYDCFFDAVYNITDIVIGNVWTGRQTESDLKQ